MSGIFLSVLLRRSMQREKSEPCCARDAQVLQIHAEIWGSHSLGMFYEAPSGHATED